MAPDEAVPAGAVPVVGAPVTGPLAAEAAGACVSEAW